MKIIRNTILYGLSSGVNAGAPLLLLPYLSNILPPSGVGLITLSTAYITIISALTTLSLNGSAYIEKFKLNTEDYAHLIRTYLIIIFFIGILINIFIVIFNATFLFNSQFNTFEHLLIASSSITGAIFILYQSILLANADAKRFAFISIISGFLNITLTIVLIKIYKSEWQSRLIAQTISNLVLMLIVLANLNKEKQLGIAKNFIENTLKGFKFGFPLLPHVICGMVTANIDKIFLRNDAEQLGLYAIALNFGQVVGLAVDSLSRSYSAQIAKSISEKNIENLVSYLKSFTVIVMIFTVFWIFIAPTITKELINQRYWEASKYIFLITIAYGANGIYSLLSQIPMYFSKTSAISKITFTTSLIHIGFSYFLTNYYGFIGASISFMLASVFQTLQMGKLSKKFF